ncbi:MAG: hypothetical protein MK052_11730 [Alphaproteobacteria bacterium]|nr:hypothetical protein [Alphaproteobacteria bacterium]
MKKTSLIATIAVLLSACSQIPDEAYFNRGSPFSLLDASSEVVNVALISEESISEVIQWVDQDQPSQAELYCLDGEEICMRTLETLEMFRVPVHFVSAADNNLVLIYDRIVARDCDNRYIDNPVNPYNLQHKTYGCSTAANMVQMVGDKRQFTSPALLDFRDGERAVQDYETYLKPLPTTEFTSENAGLQQSFQSQ